MYVRHTFDTSSTSHPNVNSVKSQKLVKQHQKHDKPPKKHGARLIGRRCMLSCLINGIHIEMLLDTGTQDSIIGKDLGQSHEKHSDQRSECHKPHFTKEKWHPPVSMDNLNEQEQQIARKMLYEEFNVFAKEDGDIDCIQDLQLKINLKDEIPVQKSYISMPKLDYVQNLLERSWIKKSTSSYSSPVFCVRKKRQQSTAVCLLLRVKLQDHSDWHPLRRIEDKLDSLGGFTWFSILEQGSALLRRGQDTPQPSACPGVYMSGFESHLALLIPKLLSSGVWRLSWKVSTMSAVFHILMTSYATLRHLANMLRT